MRNITLTEPADRLDCSGDGSTSGIEGPIQVKQVRARVIQDSPTTNRIGGVPRLCSAGQGDPLYSRM